ENNSSDNSGGIERGDRIISINGNTGIDYKSQRAKDFKEIDNYVLKETNLTVKFKKPSGDEVTRTIPSPQYDLDPVLNHQVIETRSEERRVGKKGRGGVEEEGDQKERKVLTEGQ